MKRAAALTALVLGVGVCSTTPASAIACSGTSWAGDYFNNMTLTGAPALSRCDADVDFTWGGSPAVGVNADQFSVRWTRTINFAAGTYKFNLRGDDGIRLKLDGVNILDGWKDQGAVTYTVTKDVTAGSHTVVVEFYDNTYDATPQFSYSQVTNTPVPATGYSAQYYANQTLSGTPVLSRNESAINYSWGGGSPDPAVPVDHFSARWTQQPTLEAAEYEFKVAGDDGVRVKLDGTVIIDGWKDQGLTPYSVRKTVTAGSHKLEIEYYENGGDAAVNFSYAKTTTSPPPATTDPLAATGRWTVSNLTLPARAIHTTLLKDGRILLIAGDGNDAGQFAAGTFTSKVWDPVTGATVDIPTPYDMFCAGHVTLADGRVLIMGGTSGYNGVNTTYFQGSRKSYVFDPAQMKFIALNNTNEGHWYPTPTKLGNGDVWMAGGLGDSPDPSAITVSTAVEKFSQTLQRWLTPTEAPPQIGEFWGEYPHMFLMADGRLFYSGAHTFGAQRLGSGASIYDINAGTVGDIPGLPAKDSRDQAGSVFLPPAQNQKIMIAGGGWVEQGTPPTNTTGIIDLKAANPAYVPGPSLPGPGRIYLNLTTLPDRTVLASDGGTDNRAGGELMPASIYNPATNSWSTNTPGDPVGRNYHSSTQLLPDGRVLSLGSNPTDGSYEFRVSVYEPPYLFKGARPTVTAPASATYGASVSLTTSTDAVTASLTTPGSHTHQMDSNARLVDLPITGTGTTRTATVPTNRNLLPPGPYMLTVLNASGVPSVAKWISIR